MAREAKTYVCACCSPKCRRAYGKLNDDEKKDHALRLAMVTRQLRMTFRSR